MAIPSVAVDNQVVAQESVLYLLKLIGTKTADQIFSDLSKGRYPDVDIKPGDYSSAYDYMQDAQAVALYKKAQYADFGIDTRAACIKTWLESEQRCAEYNSLLTNKTYLRDLSLNVTGVLHYARDYLRRLLGPVPVLDKVRFGPGSTAHSRGFKGSLPNKLENDSGVYKHTPKHYFKTLFDKNPAFYESLAYDASGESFVGRFKEIDYDVFDTVPKTVKTDRGISFGASLNMTLQLNVHDYVIARLKRWGIDLPHVPDLHKEYARVASIDGSLATIDLKAASDSISLELVRLLLPYEWFRLLDDIRAKRTKIDEQVYELNKFCAMGCGFTFALETIIFLAIGWATAQLSSHECKVLSVFGDDIIIDTELADDLIKNLSHLGFETNEEKTFTSGPFRESCGGDYFNGINVRPTYWKEIPDGIEGLYTISNRIRETLHCLNLRDYCTVDGRDLWESVIGLIPENFRFYGPASCGDRVIKSSRSEWIGYSKYRNQQLRVFCLGRAYDKKGRARPRKRYGKLAYALYKLGYSESLANAGYRITIGSWMKTKAKILPWEKGFDPSLNHQESVGSVDDGQIMSSTEYKLVKRHAFVYYTVDDESIAWC